MKHRIYSTIIAATAISCLTLTGCKDDSTPLPSLAECVFKGKALHMIYCREDVPGKVVAFTPGADGHAMLTLSGSFDAADFGIKGMPAIPAAGALPGSPSVTLDVALTPGDGCYTFSGASETDFATFSYSGRLESGDSGADVLTLSLDPVKLKNQMYAGKVFKPQPLQASVGDILAGKPIKSPFHIVWEGGTIPGLPEQLALDPGLLLQALTLAPVVPAYGNTAYASIAQLFDQAVQTLALLDNGNIPVRYFSSKEGASRLMTTPGAMLQYVAGADGSLRIFVNPNSALGLWLVWQSQATWLPSFFDTAYADQIKDEIDKGGHQMSEADQKLLQIVADALVKALSPSLVGGIPMQLSIAGDGVSLYLNTDTCVNFLSLLVKDILAEPAVQQRVVELLTQYGVQPEQAAKLLAQLPALLKATTRVELGLSLLPN